MNELTESNPSISIRNRSPMDIGSRHGYKFSYSCIRQDRATIVLIAVLVENKNGYTFTYICTSSLFKHLKEVAFRMLSSVVITDSLEDRVWLVSLSHA